MFIYLPTFSESNVWDFCLLLSWLRFPETFHLRSLITNIETSERGLKCWKMFQQPLSIFQSYLKGSIVFCGQINVKRLFGIFLFFWARGGGGNLNEFSLWPVIMWEGKRSIFQDVWVRHRKSSLMCWSEVFSPWAWHQYIVRESWQVIYICTGSNLYCLYNELSLNK